MDIIRAKKYFILAFLVLNIILLFSIVIENKNKSDSFTEKSVDNLYSIMEKLNISCRVPLDSKNKSLPALDGNYTPATKENFPSIYNNYANIRIIDNKWLEIVLEKKLDNYNKNSLIEYTENFIKDNLKDKKYHLKSYHTVESSTSIVYEEIVNDAYVENSYVQFIITEGYIEISILSMDINYSSKNTKLISSAEAIASVIPELKNKTVNDINIVYKSNREESEVVSTIGVTLFPMYRVETDKEEFIYINAVKN